MEDSSGVIPKPKLEEITFSVPELETSPTGTCVDIKLLGEHERPRLRWLNIETAEQWIHILRLRTPIGGVYLRTPKFSPKYSIVTVSAQGNVSEREDSNVSYFFPHEFPNTPRAASISSIRKTLDEIKGDARTKELKIPQKLKQLDCIWEIWSTDEILDEDSPLRRGNPPLESEQLELISRHKVDVYGCFMKSRRVWADFQADHLRVRPQIKIINGGLQLASDRMIQGDSITIPLTSAAGYQTNAHILVHFVDGNPDLGRKVFQPELKALAELLSVKAVSEFRRYKSHLKADTGARITGSEKDVYEWKKSQEAYRDRSPLSFAYRERRICLLSEPQEEQDVIALFHELVGIGLIRGLEFFSTNYNERYDGLFRLNYENDKSYLHDYNANPLGVSHETSLARSEPKVVEYKHNFDALCRDFSNESKFHKDINLVVCWELGSEFEEQFTIQSFLIEGEGSLRYIYGATHRVFVTGDAQPSFEVIALKDLLSFVEDAAGESARQKTRFGL